MNHKLSAFPCGYGFLVSLLIIGNGTLRAEAAQIVTANRASGDISVIDTATKEVVNFLLPDPNPEPMYVVQIASTGEVAVGDRANDQVVFFNPQNYSVTGKVSAGDGIFHMWANPQGTQLWVNDDLGSTISVINPQTKQLITTILLPIDLVADGGIPHDVVLDNSFAYVSILYPDDDRDDLLLKFSTDTFLEVARQEVEGQDPHVSLTTFNNSLYVPLQGSSQVAILDRDTLEPLSSSPILIPNAHGAGMAPDGQTFYTTNISGGGPLGLWTIDTSTKTILGDGVDTPAATPHNIALTADGQELYISHSGASSDLVSFYSLDDRVPTLAGTVNIGGLNPFGITYVASVASVPEPKTLLSLLTVGGLGLAMKRKKPS